MHLVDMPRYWFRSLEAAFIKYLFKFKLSVITELGKVTQFRIPWTTLNLILNLIIAFFRFGRPKFDPINPIIFLSCSPLLFRLSQGDCGFNPTLHIYFLLYFSPNSLIHSRGCGFNPHSLHLVFSFIFLLSLSSIQEVVGSIPTHHTYFFLLYFSPNSLIFQ